MMKKIVFLMASAVLIIIGLGGQAPAASGEIQMSFYCIAPPFAPVNVAMERMNEHLKKESDGTVKVSNFRLSTCIMV
jgi:TRAP-type C4-dicarboxylate transport system substrate-binding protein